jgi:hypothetical protein
VRRLVAQGYREPLTIANGNAGAPSTASRTVQPGPYPDSAATSIGYAAGKLTDGRTSPNGTWSSSGSVGWNMEDGLFSVTIDLGRSYDIASVRVAAHANQRLGSNWPRQMGAMVAAACAPRASGIAGQSCRATGSSANAVFSAHLEGGHGDMYGTITLPFNASKGRYVTVSGICTGWCQLDEIDVRDTTNRIVSTHRPYTLLPLPSAEVGSQTQYADDSAKLTDGAIATNYGPQFRQMVVGIPADRGGSVQATWTHPHNATTATIWMTNPNPDYRVILPSAVQIQWRDATMRWRDPIAVQPRTDCGPSPCAQLTLPAGARVTGVLATFPGEARAGDWFMISEISTQGATETTPLSAPRSQSSGRPKRQNLPNAR